MRRGRFRTCISAVALAAVSSLARADAPPDQYMLFGSVDPTIIDNYTGLIWQRTPPTTTTTFDGAASYCQGLSLNGYSNWRVPSYKELMTLVDEHPHFEYSNGSLVPHAIDPYAFPQTPVNARYWTSSYYPEDSTQSSAYVVDFKDGQANFDGLSQPLLVRCVHD